MSAFMCPKATRRPLARLPLVKLVEQGLSKPPGMQCLAASRWHSGKSSPGPGPARSLHCQGPWMPSKIRSAVLLQPTQHYGNRRTFFAPRVVRNYEDLPRDYRDQRGLPFGGKDLSGNEVTNIFGRGITAGAGNHLLRILHGRRVAGTLDDPAFAVHTAQFSETQIAHGLEYLRKTVPVEEIRNAGLRAEDELDQMAMEQESRERANRAKAESGESDQNDTVIDRPPEDPVYGHSKFDEIRARNIAKQKAKDKMEEEQRKRVEEEEEEATRPAGPLDTIKQSDGKEIENPRVAKYYQSGTSDMEAPPEMSAWGRIVPSATVVVLVVGFCAAVSMVYEEPNPRYRVFRDVTMAQATVGSLIAANALVFAAWRVPPLWRLLNKYMIMVVATVKPVTLFTAIFSHTKLSHMLVNMVPLWFVGTALHDELGRAGFLTLYLGCGATGFLTSLATYTLRGWLTVTSMGASGATLGLCSAYFWEHRNDGFKIFGLPQDGVHGIVFLAAITALQLAGLGRTKKLRVDIASHLGGIAAGVLGVEMINRARGRQGPVQMRERKRIAGSS